MPVFGIDETNPTESYGELQARLPDISGARALSMIRPDRLQDLDVTELNLMKQKYVKPVEKKTEEDYELYTGVLNVIQDHIKTPFTMRERGSNVEKVVTDCVTPKKKYLIMHISECFELSKKYFYPAEFALAEFSVFNGVGDGVSGMIDIGKVPSGWGSAELDRRRLTCNPRPSFDENFHPYDDALKLIEDFSRRHFKDDDTAIVFALKENIVVVNSGLDYLKEKTKEKDPKYVPMKFCVLPFTCLLQALVNESPLVKDSEDEEGKEPIIRHESNVQDVVDDMTYAYAPELACDYHSRPENESGVQYCSENIVKRTIYNSCLFLKECWSFTPKSNHHWPRYYQTLRTITKSKGFTVYEPEQTSRFDQVPRFNVSDTMSDRLGWTSGDSSSGSSVGSSNESIISGDGSDSSSVRIKILDQDPQNQYKKQEYGRRLNSNRRSKSSASSDTLSEYSSFTSSSQSSVSDDHSENTSQKNSVSEFRSPKSGTADRRAGRGRGCRVAMKALKDINVPGSPLQALPEEDSASYDGELESASSSVGKLPSGFVPARLWTPSVESSVSDEDSSYYRRTRGRGKPCSSHPTDSGSTFASGMFSSDVTGPYLDWGRTFRKARSTASADSFDDSASVGVYGIGERAYEDDDDIDQQFDSITLVNAPHAHGSNDDDNGNEF